MSSDEPQPADDDAADDAPAHEAEEPQVNRCEFPIGPATALDPDGQMCCRDIPDTPGKRGPKSKYCGLDNHTRHNVVRARLQHGLLLGPATTTATAVPARKVSDAQGVIGPLIEQFREVAEAAAAQQAALVNKINRAVAQVTDPEAAAEEVGEIERQAQRLISEADEKRLAVVRDLRQLERERDTFRERAEEAEATTAEAVTKEQAALQVAEQARIEQAEAAQQAQTYIQEVTAKAAADVELHLERARVADEQRAAALDELERIRAEAVRQIEATKTEAAEQIAAARAEAAEQITQAKADAEAQTRAIHLEAAAEIEEAHNTADARVQAAEAAAAAQIEEAKTEAAEQVRQAREDAQEKVDTAVSTARDQVNAVRAELAKIEEAATKLRTTASEEAAARIRAEAEKNAATQQSERDQDTIKRLRTDLDQAREQARTSLAELKVDITELKAELAQEKTGRENDRAVAAQQLSELTQALTGARQAAAETPDDGAAKGAQKPPK